MLAQEVADAVGWADAIRLAGMVVALLAGLSGLGWALSRRIKNEAKVAALAAEDARRQVATSNGHTAGQLIESTAAEVSQLRQAADANRARLDAVDVRLDRHIVHGHRADP